MYTVTLKDTANCINKLTEIAAKCTKEWTAADISAGNRNDVIVEKLTTDHFKIYKALPLFTYTEGALSDFMALVRLSDESAFVEIKMKRLVLIFLLVWYGCFIVLSTYLLLNEKFAGLIFIFLMLLAPVFLIIEKKRFKRFVVDFMNNL